MKNAEQTEKENTHTPEKVRNSPTTECQATSIRRSRRMKSLAAFKLLVIAEQSHRITVLQYCTRGV